MPASIHDPAIPGHLLGLESLMPSCVPSFTAGTLVHTDKGMVPIEKVRVGTQVLSQPEYGGERVWRPVIHTVAHLDQQVYAVQLKVVGCDVLSILIATGNQLFWVESPLIDGKHWMAAQCLNPGFVLQLADGRKASVHATGQIRHTQHAHIGFAENAKAGVGIMLDIGESPIRLANDEMALGLEKLELREPYLTPVYNFEVETFHTCYVGNIGVWVHNANCQTAEALNFRLRKVEPSEPRFTCFPVDTYVMARGGHCVEIDRLGVGSWVLSRCEKTGEQAYRRVVKKFEHGTEGWDAQEMQLYRVAITTAEGKTDVLAVTAEHPFWVNGIGWVKAGELQAGQMLEICDPLATDDCDRPLGQKTEDVILSGQRWQAEVVSVNQSWKTPLVYNIEVEDFHTYFVGVFGVWVHNKNQGEPDFRRRFTTPVPTPTHAHLIPP